MIQRSASLKKRLEAECVRYCGSLARLVFYKGTMPLRCELVADGERVANIAATEAVVRALHQGEEPGELFEDGNYWRLIDANGNVIMQGCAS